MFKNRIAQRAAAFLAAIAAIIALAGSPAQAAWTCEYGYICVYETEYGNGASYRWGPNTPTGCYNLGYPWNDRVRSVYNRQYRNVTFHIHAGCSSANSNSYWPVVVYSFSTKSMTPAQYVGPRASSFYVW